MLFRSVHVGDKPGLRGTVGWGDDGSRRRGVGERRRERRRQRRGEGEDCRREQSSHDVSVWTGGLVLRAIRSPSGIRRAAGLDRCRKYALGCGALYAKHLSLQPWKRKPGILAAYVRMLGYSLGGMALNLARPDKAYYYLNSLWYKLLGSLEYGFSTPHGSGDA